MSVSIKGVFTRVSPALTCLIKLEDEPEIVEQNTGPLIEVSSELLVRLHQVSIL